MVITPFHKNCTSTTVDIQYPGPGNNDNVLSSSNYFSTVLVQDPDRHIPMKNKLLF